VFFACWVLDFYVRAKKGSAIQVRQHAEPYAKCYAAAWRKLWLDAGFKIFSPFLALISSITSCL